MVEKLSNEQKIAVMSEVPGVIRSLVTERDFYRDKLANVKQRLRVEKLASTMIEKGLRSGDISQVANELEKEASEEGRDLNIIEEAVDLVGPDMGKKANVSDEIAVGGSTELERYLTS
jgi:hypothetical protein